MQLYNLYEDHAIKLYTTPSRIIQLQIISQVKVLKTLLQFRC